jgi:Uma2 family endonuclease
MSTFVCENVLMATLAARQATIDPDFVLYRLDRGVYDRLVAAGALEGIDVELRDGLLVDRHAGGTDAIHLLDLDTYNRMVETGELDELPLELLDGLLVEMTRQGVPHAVAIMRLTRHLGTARAWLRVQLPLEVMPRSEPEPDLALQRGPGSAAHHPRTLLLAVEVAVTSQSKDRNRKSRLYAEASIPIYWVVDVPRRTVEVRTEPGPRGYERCATYGISDAVPSPAEGVADLDVAWLFDTAA